MRLLIQHFVKRDFGIKRGTLRSLILSFNAEGTEDDAEYTKIFGCNESLSGA